MIVSPFSVPGRLAPPILSFYDDRIGGTVKDELLTKRPAGLLLRA
jgi:hypothetical protein